MNVPTGPPIPKARILVVDDESPTRTAVARALNLMGYRAEEASSGEQALSMLSSEPYDLILLDLRMPGLDGVEVMNRLKESLPSLLVIVFTAHATLESAIQAVRAGAVDYLLKPCSIRDIEQAISQALQRRHGRLRRQHFIRLMAEALEGLQDNEDEDPTLPAGKLERFVRYGPISLDREKRLVVVAGLRGMASTDANLTDTEVALLAYLMQHPDMALSSRHLARGALGYDIDEAEAQAIVRPHISRLRKKMEPDSAHPRLLRTIRGKGYLLSLE